MGTLVTQGYVQIDGNDIVSLQRALDESFESHTFAGGYKGALELLLNGKVDVAFGSDIAPEKTWSLKMLHEKRVYRKEH